MRKLAFASGATAGIAGVAAWFALKGLRTWKDSREFALGSAAKVIRTECGPVEFVEWGHGPAILVVHGAFGGFDQAAVIAAASGLDGYRFICPSRPGYLGTPLSTGYLPEDQADALAALLDELGIAEAAVLGVSAGGPVAIQFAARHPMRCRSLILVSAISTDFCLKTRHTIAGNPMIRPLGDFATWMMEAAASRDVLGMAKVILTPAERLRMNDPETRMLLTELFRSYTPFSLRRPGFRNDLSWVGCDPLPVQRVQQPTLVVHGTQDFVVPFSHAEHVASLLPHAELLAVEDGGHVAGLMFRHDLQPRLAEFLRSSLRLAA